MIISLLSGRLTLALGNIADQPDCDVIVNSANSNLRLGSGVSGAIHTAAGPDLEEFCEQFRPLELAQAVITPGFALPNRWVIHVRAPHYLQDRQPKQNLVNSVVAALHLADANDCSRLGMPALSTGKFEYPIIQASELIVWTARKYLVDRDSKLAEVRIVLATQAAFEVFEKAFAFYENYTDDEG
ncbi:MAG: RNase III inhibitor [Alcaligenaceae bacterium]|nr:MAG: RNase III inhibitor [Alcaligenaceae bacterium]